MGNKVGMTGWGRITGDPESEYYAKQFETHFVYSGKPRFENSKSCGVRGQDGGIGRNPSLPRTTKRRITTNLKSINNQKYQKIKLHGTLTTKELKKKSTRTTKPIRWWT